MIIPLILKEEAVEEASNAYKWYEEKRKGLGEDFLAALDIALNQIQTNSLSYPVIYKDKRVFVLNDYPYVIVFEVQTNTVIIYAIFHTSRNQNIWKKRKK